MAAELESHLLPRYQIEGRKPLAYSLTDRMKHYRVPAISIAIIRAGKIDRVEAWGVVDAGGRKVDSNTLFQAASISKPVSALAAVHMSQYGNFGLDDDVNAKLKSWQVPKSEFNGTVTLRRLLSHSAGLTVHGFPGYASTAELPTVPQILDGAMPANTAAVRVNVEPGSIWRYSGGGYTVMQLLLSDASRMAFPELMHKMVLSRIGMTRSTYAQPLPDIWHENAARGHHGDGKMVEGRWHTYPEMAAAGLWTTPGDLARFAIEVWRSSRGESNKVIERASALEMLKVQKGNYGLGFSIDGEGASLRFGHGGSNNGFKCNFVMFRESGDGIVVMTNGDNGANLANELIRGAADLNSWPALKAETRKAVTLSAAELAKYAGTFEFGGQFNGPQLRVVFADGRLWGYPPGDRPRAELVPESAESFFPLVDTLPPLKFIRGLQGQWDELQIPSGAKAKRIPAK
jgi:CubicO group peptidase (beta-lactamase class C family)